jgi:hypothetical protein
MATKLTDAQLAAARQALQASAATEDKAFTDQILFEQRRDERAYALIKEAAAETPKRRLSFGEAQALATDELRKPAAAPVQAASEAPEKKSPKQPA